MEPDTEKQRSFKVKLAMFFGYNGENYRGMQFQRNQTVRTVENTLHDILFRLGFILESNTTDLKRVKWSRAARTDKRVHALCNAVSTKLQISKDYIREHEKQLDKAVDKHNIDYDKIINELNAVLPKDIRLYAIKKVTKKFDIRHDAKCRRYNYLLPTFVFQDYKDILAGVQQTQQELAQLVSNLNEKVKNYLKTHNYHNFTRRLKETDMRCNRYMLSMSVELVGKEPVEEYCKLNSIENTRGIRFLRFELLGQSFVYHQIRKMIGLLVQTKVQKLADDVFKRAFSMEKMRVFLAPGEGLYLNQVTFDNYNRKNDIPEKLEFTVKEQERIEEFRKEIEQVIFGHELKEQEFTNWIRVYYENPDNTQQKEQSEEEPEEDESMEQKPGKKHQQQQ